MSKEKALFIIDNGYVCMFSEQENEYIPFCKEIKVENRLHVFDKDEWYVTISFKNPSGDEVEQIVPQSQFKRAELLALMNSGIDIHEDNVKWIKKYLYWVLDNDENIPIKKAHKSLGWVYNKKNERTNVYRLDTLIGSDLDSKYIGDLPIKEKGKFEDTLEFFQKELTGFPPLQLALTLGVTAILLGIVAEETDMENLFININGNSSTGKSTALSLAMSPFGSPSVSSARNSLIRNWSSTDNALIKTISSEGVESFPVAYDEVGMSAMKSYSQLIYRLCAGQEKQRMQRDGTILKTQSFRTVLLSSGELRIQDLMKEKTLGSSVVRLTEINNVCFTSSAAQSNKIKRFVNQNHGTFAKQFISNIINNHNSKELIKTWYEYTDELTSDLKPYVSQFAERIASKFSLILLAFTLVDEIIGMDWELQPIIDILINSAKDKENEIKMLENAYNTLMEYVLENQSHFIKFTGTTFSRSNQISKDNPPNSVWGKMNDKHIVITRSQFEKVMESRGFKNIRIILGKFLKNDIIVAEQDKGRTNYYNRLLIDGMKVTCLVIKRDVEFSDENEKD